MLKLNRIVDYGILIVCHLLRETERGKAVSSAKEIATSVHLSQPMVSKILKSLLHAGIVRSERGLRGGYSLSPEARSLSLGGLVRALDGPIRLTDCSPGAPAKLDDGCELHSVCSLSGTMQRVNLAVQHAFDNVLLVEIALPPAPKGRGVPLPGLRPGALGPEASESAA